MKTYPYLILIVLTCNCAFAQLSVSNHTWKITLQVVDEHNNPLSAAKAGVGFYTNSQPTSINGITDTNGLFEASQAVESSGGGYLLGFSAEKDGYYTTRSTLNLDAEYDPVKWNPTVTILIKQIGKPIAMYAKKYAMALKLPEYGKRVGYDLMIGDWVGPYGKGISTDVIFEQDYTNEPSGGYYSKITFAFPKVGDGVQLYTIPDSETGSDLRSPHIAPTDGYLPEMTRETSALQGQPSKFEFDPNRIYLFRVRTAKDHDGNIVSAHYGKIYGDFMQFTYYLNPTPNDRNIEFDPKQNLLQGLQSFEAVQAP